MQPQVYHVSGELLDSKMIDDDALFVVQRLREAGYETYLVGGCVRDLLAKRVPKDFDISTAARPEDVKRVFKRNCLLIGRRFRLAHIRFGHKVIEVATFRSGDNEGDLILQDNTWGGAEEDALRRDFTINGLFYDPTSQTVIDYVGGWKDISHRTLRTIGEPTTRFKQDPVRMIRLLKFMARFSLDVAPDCQKALLLCRDEIIKSSPARVLEEFLRMLESGYSSTFIKLMSEYEMLELLFPCLTHFLEGKYGEKIYQYLRAADAFNRENSKALLDRNILMTCLLFPILERELHIQYLDKKLSPHLGDIIILTSVLLKGMVTSSFPHFPRRMGATVGYILSTQYRFTPLSGKKHHHTKVFASKEFPLALAFLRLRATVEPKLQSEYKSWLETFKHHEKQRERRGHHPHSPPSHSKEKDLDADEEA